MMLITNSYGTLVNKENYERNKYPPRWNFNIRYFKFEIERDFYIAHFFAQVFGNKIREKMQCTVQSRNAQVYKVSDAGQYPKTYVMHISITNNK